MELKLIVDLLGWTGAVALLSAYGLISAKKVDGHSPLYQVLNIIGSVLLIVNSTYYRAFPSAFVNVVWLGIAGYTIFSIRNTIKKRGPA